MMLNVRAAREVEGRGTSWKPIVVDYPLTLAPADHRERLIRPSCDDVHRAAVIRQHEAVVRQ
jgi:hypothetical protein